MRFRRWLTFTAAVAVIGAGLSGTAFAQTDTPPADETSDHTQMHSTMAGTMAQPSNPYQNGDMLGMIHSITRPEVQESVKSAGFWFDIGGNFPMGSFQDRQWTNGFSLQFGHKVWDSGGIFNVDGVFGVFMNEDSRFNETQSRAYYAAGPGYAGGPVEAHRHLLVPFSVELKIEGQDPAFSPFVALGPSMNWARETTVWQDSTKVIPVVYVGDDWLTDEAAYIPDPSAFTAHSVKNLTKIHPGYAARGGIRFRFADSAARVMVTMNTWYERAHPLTMFGAFLSFGL